MAYEAPKLMPKYEPPILLDLDGFTTVQGNCCTGGGSCNGDVVQQMEG